MTGHCAPRFSTSPASRCSPIPPARCSGKSKACSSSPTCIWKRAPALPRAACCCRPTTPRRRLSRLAAVVARHDPRMVIALGDSFHDRTAHERLSDPDRDAIAALQVRRDWVWIAGNHDPALPSDLGGVVASEVCIGPIAFRHEPTGASGEIAGHLHPKARVPTRGRTVERRCFACDGERAVMPSFGAYTGGLSIRDKAFARIFGTPGFHGPCARRQPRARLRRVAVLLSPALRSISCRVSFLSAPHRARLPQGSDRSRREEHPAFPPGWAYEQDVTE